MNNKSSYYQEFEHNNYPNPALAIFTGLFHEQKIPYLSIDAKLEQLSCSDIIERLESELGENLPVFIMITNSTTTLIEDDLNMVRLLKRRFPEIPIVMGGPHVSALPIHTLDKCKELDIVCKNEGISAILNLYNYYFARGSFRDFETIRGIAYRDNHGMIKVNPDHGKKDLDAINLGRPRWEEFSKAAIYHVFTAMGCPYRCSYCYNITNQRFTLKPISRVIEELHVLIEKCGMTHFCFADATFGVNKLNTIKLLQRMINEGISKKVSWDCWTRVDVLDEELAITMKHSGCSSVSLGLESGSNKVLRRANKKTTTDQIESAVKVLKKTGIYCKCFIVFGHIGETIEDIKKTIELTIKINPDEVGVGVMTPWPGTEVFELAVKGEEGFSLASNDFSSFDKYFGEAMINKKIGLDKLNSLRNEMYLRLYIDNHRYQDLMKFVWDMKKPILRKARSLLKAKACY